jgi:hypothetical protein
MKQILLKIVTLLFVSSSVHLYAQSSVLDRLQALKSSQVTQVYSAFKKERKLQNNFRKTPLLKRVIAPKKHKPPLMKKPPKPPKRPAIKNAQIRKILTSTDKRRELLRLKNKVRKLKENLQRQKERR